MHHTQTRVLWNILGAAFLAFALAAILPLAANAAPDGALLAGTVKSASGAKLNGVTISAKMDNSTITKSVFTDEDGAYYFPAMPAGHYDVWAQADGFDTARGDASLSHTTHRDFILHASKDFERQLTGDQILASLPDATPDDHRLKRIVRNTCTSCHQLSRARPWARAKRDEALGQAAPDG
jgi:hypothetical protein